MPEIKPLPPVSLGSQRSDVGKDDAPSVRRDTPSVRAVSAALGGHPLTAADIRQVSGLPRRTVYAALRVLDDRGVLRQRGSLHDTRQTFYWLVSASVADAPTPPVRGLSLPGMSSPAAPPA